MTLDLTEQNEQDWLNKRPSPVRYTELTTRGERLSEATDQLVGPLAVELSDRLAGSEHLTDTTLSERQWQRGAVFVLESDILDLEAVFQSVETPETARDNWLVQYLRAVAVAIVDSLSEKSIERVMQFAIDGDDDRSVE